MKYVLPWGPLKFEILNDGDEVYQGIFQRYKCDTYQPQWCMGIKQINKDFKAGEYEVVAEEEKVCQNAASDGDGYIKVYVS